MFSEIEKPLRELALNEPLMARARLMTGVVPANAPNGIKLVRVLSVDNLKNEALLEMHFFNLNRLADIIAAYAVDRSVAKKIFPISGGSRIRAGAALGQVQVDGSPLPAPASIVLPSPTVPVLVLRVAPIGDYSTYTIGISALQASGWVFDPLFAEIGFKFRPGCFNTNCAPGWDMAMPPLPEPSIDYLAKDYGSFRKTMIAAMMERVPGWEPTSEGDLDMVLAELFSVAADELSDFQDRVMNEAYLASSRKRVSIARHARLMDYHIHQGNQASTWLALEILHFTGPTLSFQLKEGLKVWAGESNATTGTEIDAAVHFVSRHATQTVHQYLNSLGLYTWSNSITTLTAGSTRADLKVYQKYYLDDTASAIPDSTESAAKAVQDLIRNGKVKHLLIQEHLNPETGFFAGRDPNKRQLLNLISGHDLATAATALQDPVTGEWFVRVRWEKKDALRRDYCFRVECPAAHAGTAIGPVDNISLFHGNLIEVFHGKEGAALFKNPGEILGETEPLQFHYERTRWGALCRLPDAPLLYRYSEPGGDVPPVSTLDLQIKDPALGTAIPWYEVPSFIHSDDSAKGGDHFVVETDEAKRSVIRFGNGRNGMELSDTAEVTVKYQFGEPTEGNVGADSILYFDAASVSVDPNIPVLNVYSCWNPFDVTNGRDREPVVEILRRVPEAYRQRQLRAVTLADYVAWAERIEGVSRAAAKYAWTGSWRTVLITIDPIGTNVLSDSLRKQVEAELNAIRLIGEDIEVRPPRFVPLEIKVAVCATPEVWPEDIQFVLEQEFSDGWTPDGRMGFFHPDLWTFGQALHASQIIGRAMLVSGVEHFLAKKAGPTSSGPLISVSIKRWNSPFPPVESLTQLDHNEIIMVQNDPDHMEFGTISFEIKGGRR